MLPCGPLIITPVYVANHVRQGFRFLRPEMMSLTLVNNLPHEKYRSHKQQAHVEATSLKISRITEGRSRVEKHGLF